MRTLITPSGLLKASTATKERALLHIHEGMMQGVKAANSLLICTAHSQLGADLLRRTAEGEAQMRPSSPWDIPYDVYMPPPSPSGEVGRVGASGEVHLLTFSQHNNFRSLLSEVSL